MKRKKIGSAMKETNDKASDTATWLLIAALVALILSAGLFTLFVVGDQGQPSWEYRPVRDVPGESPYAIYEPLPYPQHIQGSKGE
jgi:hypothetical protein